MTSDLLTTISPSRLVGDLLRHHSTRTPAAPFIRFGQGEWLSYQEVDQRSDRVAAGLARLGVVRGDRVAIVSPNRIEMVDTIFACAKIGAIEVALSAWLKGEFLRYQVEDADPKVLIADQQGLHALRAVGTTNSRTIVALDQPQAGQVPFGDLLSCSDAVPTPELVPADLMAILYTSGTTGMPKGCMLSHGYFTTAPQTYVRLWDITPEDRIMTALPLFHGGGQLIVLMDTLLAGASVSYETVFSASAFMTRAAACDATILIGVGPMGKAILAQPPSETDRQNKVRIANFPPMDPAARAAFESRFDTTFVIEGYGQTECSPSCLGGPSTRREDGASVPSPNLEVAVVDEHDNPLPPGVVGEIVVRPRVPQAMYSGYWRKPEETLAAWNNLWHHTGDNGIADVHGTVRFVDRRKDSLRRRGENVSSLELEGAIGTIDAVRQVAITAVPSPLGEDDIRATIIWEGDLPKPDALFDLFASLLPYYAIPRYVEFRDSLPTTVTGRVMKHVLRSENLAHDVIDFEALGLSVARDERRRV